MNHFKFTLKTTEFKITFSDMKIERNYDPVTQSYKVKNTLYYVGNSLCIKIINKEQYVPLAWYYGFYLTISERADSRLETISSLQESINSAYVNYLFESTCLTNPDINNT